MSRDFADEGRGSGDGRYFACFFLSMVALAAAMYFVLSQTGIADKYIDFPDDD